MTPAWHVCIRRAMQREDWVVDKVRVVDEALVGEMRVCLPRAGVHPVHFQRGSC